MNLFPSQDNETQSEKQCEGKKMERKREAYSYSMMYSAILYKPTFPRDKNISGMK